MKKLICIGGTILFSLQIGKRAVIVKGGDCIYTSRVVEILSETKEAVCFKTMNSVYKFPFCRFPLRCRCLPNCPCAHNEQLRAQLYFLQLGPSILRRFDFMKQIYGL